ncbi:MAG: hypothetical protein JRG97_06295 [Deltaproteobacteria bacterium]|nr:hypothetical protein [Deltaproteobacteria bacterium]MBW2140666.1 hypothetical protein [Deltaproteobacteria bacterium]
MNVKSENKIIYYPGCFVNYFDHETGRCIVNILEKNDLQVEVPEFTCCSYTLYNSGNITHARKRASRLVETLTPYAVKGYEIIYSCPTCGLALKEVYPNLLNTDEARVVADRTTFISSFLLALHEEDRLNIDFKDISLNIAYHAPCHLKSQNLFTESTTLLSLIPGISLNDLNRGCCGMGGTWGLQSKKQSELSGEVGVNVFQEIKETKPQLVVTECAGCQIQIGRYTGYPCNLVIHPLRIFADAYNK